MRRYQLTAYDQPYGPVSDNGSWQVGDWGDTMMLTNVANGGAVRWRPGPVDVVGGPLAHRLALDHLQNSLCNAPVMVGVQP